MIETEIILCTEQSQHGAENAISRMWREIFLVYDFDMSMKFSAFN